MIPAMHKPRPQQLFLIAILLVGLWLRVHRLVELPPGLHYDEAANGILSGDIALRGARPIFITSYTGKEPLFFYLAALLMRLIGESTFALRLTAAFLGLLTIATTYRLSKEIALNLPSSFRFSLSTFPLLTALLLATHFPHLIFSRLGFRAVAQPLFQGLTVVALLHGTRKRKWGSIMAAGLLLGLTAYTYLASRLFPLLFGLMILPLLRKWWRQMGVLLAGATTALSPLAHFFWQHPDTFWVRIGQVAGDNLTTIDYAKSVWRSWGMFGRNGDPYWRFNIPNQPLLGIGLFIAWLIGMGMLVWWLRSARGAQLAVILLLLFTPVIMILPTALAFGEIIPSNLRAIGLYPFLLIPIALPLSALIDRLPQRWQFSVAPMLLVVTFLLANGAYFGRWGTRADTFYDSDADLVALSRYLDSVADQYADIYVGALHYRHPTVAFSSPNYDRIKWLVGSAAVVRPASNNGLLLFPHSSPPPDWLRDQPTLTAPLGPDGQILFWAYESAAITPPAITQPPDLPANFSNLIQLDQSALRQPASTQPTLQLFWTILATPERNFTPFVHIVDATGYRWVQVEPFAYAAEQWAVGEQVVQEVALPLPAGMAAGDYAIIIGLFDGNERLPLVDQDGRFAGNTLQSTHYLAGNGEQPEQSPQVVLNQEIATGVVLWGYDRPNSAETSTQFPLTLYWHITQSPSPAPLAIQLNGTTLARPTIPPQASRPYYAVQRLPIPIPETATSGDLLLNALNLGYIDIQATQRTFSTPPFEQTSNANFANQITLLGYTLTAQKLSLIWQAQSDNLPDYTIFVHLLNPDGTCCVWQQDTPPQQGQYPTSRWITDEIIIDEYVLEFEVDNGATYPLEIGVYSAENGQRLPIIGGDDHLLLDPITP